LSLTWSRSRLVVLTAALAVTATDTGGHCYPEDVQVATTGEQPELGFCDSTTYHLAAPAVFQGHELVSWLYNGQYLGAGSEVDLVTAPTGFTFDQLMLQYR